MQLPSEHEAAVHCPFSHVTVVWPPFAFPTVTVPLPPLCIIARTFFIPASYFKLPWDEFLDKYLQLVSPGPFYVDRDDLENTKGLKTFLGYEETTD